MTEMKIHIMTDMEGCAGVMCANEYIYSNSKYYEEARDLVSLEVSAAVEGALEAGATEVLVADGHGPSALKRSLLHPRAKLLGGRPYSPGQRSAATAPSPPPSSSASTPRPTPTAATSATR
jgi:D-amino peptidase